MKVPVTKFSLSHNPVFTPGDAGLMGVLSFGSQ